MAEEVIKTTSCCNDAMMGGLLGAMANRNNDPLSMAALLRKDDDSQWDNPFIYLVWMMFAQRMWGNDWNNGQNAQNVELQNQIQSLRSQIADNQNSNMIMDAIKGNGCAIQQLAANMNCDFNALNSAICDVRQGISTLSGQVGFSAERVINAINLGDMNLVQQLKDCCCRSCCQWLLSTSTMRCVFAFALVFKSQAIWLIWKPTLEKPLSIPVLV